MKPRRPAVLLSGGVASGSRCGDTPVIVVMKPGAKQALLDQVIEHIEQLDLRTHVIVGTECTVVAALREKRDGANQPLPTLQRLDKEPPLLAPSPLATT